MTQIHRETTNSSGLELLQRLAQDFQRAGSTRTWGQSIAHLSTSKPSAKRIAKELRKIAQSLGKIESM